MVGEQVGRRRPPCRHCLAPVRGRLKPVDPFDREVPRIEPDRYFLGRDPMRDLGQLVRRGRSHPDGTQRIPAADRAHAVHRQYERRLLGELADRARPGDLVGAAEPFHGEVGVPRMGRPAGERDVPGKEPAGPAALDHEELHTVRGVAPGDHR